ncbi:DUF1405 domain-containing protein [Staphylococcus canis]|uniref:DUF1405 domain-containing protein n=1 Tax=Staphylococcus canis TaxID=2724942 RepID=A0ABS0T9I2_9STAP|nr:DUF1405 domain-containing protein [Staphylococcus canis]MBI5975363.1 DUF1405 domain-containing protein [Staphylococcus canis]
MTFRQLWHAFIYDRFILIFLFICNFLGTVYGYYWYIPQLIDSQKRYWLFIPDSPTATLCLLICIGLYLFNRQSIIFETLAFVTLIKYGIWAVIMNIFMFSVDENVTITGLMLIISHSIMAFQAFLFLPRFKFTLTSIFVTLLWIFHNDVIDYVFHQYPVYGSLTSYESIIGYIAFWLSILPIAITFYIYWYRRTKKFDRNQSYT